MNSKRAANRARSMMKGERMESMRGRKIAHREPEHHETGGGYGHTKAAPFGVAHQSASMGPGPLPGAGMTPAIGPGRASRSYAAVDKSTVPTAAAPSGKAPRGMTTIMQGE